MTIFIVKNLRNGAKPAKVAEMYAQNIFQTTAKMEGVNTTDIYTRRQTKNQLLRFKKMKRSDEILQYLRTQVESATLSEIYANVSFGYHHNGHKHLGVILGKLVSKGKVERIKQGVFKISEYTQESELQQKLF